ncbi:MAG: M24 family metallopeptidase [Pseudomonadota bacterium]
MNLNVSDQMRREHHATVVERLRSLMTEAGLDALVAMKNENFTYINTLSSSFLGMAGMTGLAMIVVPREGTVSGVCCDFERPGLEAASMVAEWRDFPMWIYVDDQFISSDKPQTKKEKPEFFELGLSLRVLTEILKAAGLERGRLGLEISALQVPIWAGLQKALPQASFTDATTIFYTARSVKTPYEIECLRHAAKIQEKNLFGIMAEVQVGQEHAEIISRLQSRALASPGIDSIRFMFLSLGKNFAPCQAPSRARVAPGDLIKYDGALVTRGYGADAARTFIVGRPSPDQERVNKALTMAHHEALKMMKPGAIPKDVFYRAMSVANENGLPNYLRGHIGHSVGLDQSVEEPPFMSPLNDKPLRPGNVFCVEMPYYAHNFGSIMNEDIVLITEDGAQFLTKAERKLHPIGLAL